MTSVNALEPSCREWLVAHGWDAHDVEKDARSLAAFVSGHIQRVRDVVVEVRAKWNSDEGRAALALIEQAMDAK